MSQKQMNRKSLAHGKMCCAKVQLEVIMKVFSDWVSNNEKKRLRIIWAKLKYDTTKQLDLHSDL